MEELLGLALLILLIVGILFVVGWLMQAALWFLVMTVLSLPATGGAFLLMWIAQSYFCKRHLGRLKRGGKLGDMINVHFGETGIEWSLDKMKIMAQANFGELILLLFAMGVASAWMGLNVLGRLGVFGGTVGSGVISGNPHTLAQANAIVAYFGVSVGLGAVLVLLPRKFSDAMTIHARAHIQSQDDRLQRADVLFRTSLNVYNRAADAVAQTGSVTLLRELDKTHLGLHSTALAEFVKAERWDEYEAYTQGLITDLEELYEMAASCHDESAGATQEEIRRPSQDHGMTEKEALRVLGLIESATPEEINKAWLDLLRQYHLDRWLSKSSDEDVLNLVHEKNKAVNRAHQVLKDIGRAA